MSQRDENNTTNYYDNNADQFTNKHYQYLKGSYWEVALDKLQEYIPSGHILEIGSGPGRDAEALMQRGYEYTGIDVSKGLLEIARKRNPNATLLEKSVYNLDFDIKFDGFWSTSNLFHIPKSQISEALSQIKKNMKSNAVGFISVKKGEGEKVEKNTHRFFAYYSLDEFALILENNNFEILESETMISTGKTHWLMYWVKVRK